MNVFGVELKVARVRKGLRQKDLAKMSGTSESSIARYETGLAMPNVETAIALADALDCSLDTLAGRSAS